MKYTLNATIPTSVSAHSLQFIVLLGNTCSALMQKMSLDLKFCFSDIGNEDQGCGINSLLNTLDCL